MKGLIVRGYRAMAESRDFVEGYKGEENEERVRKTPGGKVSTESERKRSVRSLVNQSCEVNGTSVFPLTTVRRPYPWSIRISSVNLDI